MQRKLAAILVADIVGYSAMMGADEARALAFIKFLREESFEPLVVRWRGEVVKRLGDGWIVEFPSVVDAVTCAVAVQNQMLDIEGLDLRIGLHIGDIVHSEGDIYGDGVNIAARLEALGTPGHVLISDDVHRQILGRVTETFHDLGQLELKNIAQSVRVWSWPEVPETLTRFRAAGKKPQIHVAKFEAFNNDAAELAMAIREDLVTAFGRQTGISLVTSSSTADFVVLGSIRSAAGRWRISARLEDCSGEQMIWSERFDETGEDLFDLQDRCVTRIAGAVRIRVPALLGRLAAAKSMQEMSVEDLLNYAVNCHFSPTNESWDNALSAMELVLQRDSKNWMAMIMLGYNLLSRSRILGWRKLTDTDEQRVRELVEGARLIKPDSEVVRTVNGYFQLYAMGDHGAARLEAEASATLNPDFYHSINLMSQILLFTGNFENALSHALRAVDCDPGYPYLHLYQRDLGYVYLVSGDYTNAIDRFQRADRAAPRLPQNLIGLTVSTYMGGNQDAAETTADLLLELVPDFNLEAYAPWPFSDSADWTPYKEALLSAGIPLSATDQ